METQINGEIWVSKLLTRWGIEEADIKCENCQHRQYDVQFTLNGQTFCPCICPEPCAPGVSGSGMEALAMVQIDDQCPGFYPAQIIVENPEAWVPYEY